MTPMIDRTVNRRGETPVEGTAGVDRISLPARRRNRAMD